MVILRPLMQNYHVRPTTYDETRHLDEVLIFPEEKVILFSSFKAIYSRCFTCVASPPRCSAASSRTEERAAPVADRISV